MSTKLSGMQIEQLSNNVLLDGFLICYKTVWGDEKCFLMNVASFGIFLPVLKKYVSLAKKMCTVAKIS